MDIYLNVLDEKIGEIGSSLLIIPIFQDDNKKPLFNDLPDCSRTPLEGFKGKKKDTRVFYEGDFQAKKLLLLGAGKISEFELSDVTELGGIAHNEAKKQDVEDFVFSFPMELSLNREKVARELSLGIKLAAYKFEKYKSEKDDEEDDKKEIKSVTLALADGRSLPTVKRGFEAGCKIAAAVAASRDLGNTPGNELSPADLAASAGALASKYDNLCVQAWDEKKLEKEGMNLIMAVGRGSVHPPGFIELKYEPVKSKGTAVLVGKGVTFDSGGISLKPGKKMDEMKFDMSGAGVVLGVVQAVCELELPVRIIALIPTAENMPASNSTRPGDIVKGYSGKTVEILNTDAEGRLILADALAYASENYGDELDVMIDYATLTGACIVALGHQAAALLSDDEQLSRQLEESGNEISERVWRLPLWKEYSKKIESKIADVKNVGGRAGTITGGCFLKEFVDEDKIKSWAHLDIAGTAWEMEKLSYRPEGATGFGVRLTVEFLNRRFNL